jgi:iron complex transport system substrate-binding protein
MSTTRRAAALAAACTLAAGLAACGSDDGDPQETGAPPSSEATDTSDTTEAPADGPERIVSLSPTGTEMLFAIGAGDQVVAVDDQSDFPEGVPTTDLSGYEPNLEAIIEYEPDLVVAGGLAEDIVTGLEAVGAEVFDLPAAVTLDDAYGQIADLGIATGHEDEAAEVVATMRADIDELVAEVPERVTPPTYYHELDDTLYTVTSATFIGEIYGLAGLSNVADEADPAGEFGGYPQLSPEFLVTADPDFIFLADTECCGQDAGTVAARPGFAGLSAVADDQVVELSDDIASRWGPRVVDLLRTIVEATAGVPVG